MPHFILEFASCCYPFEEQHSSAECFWHKFRVSLGCISRMLCWICQSSYCKQVLVLFTSYVLWIYVSEAI